MGLCAIHLQLRKESVDSNGVFKHPSRVISSEWSVVINCSIAHEATTVGTLAAVRVINTCATRQTCVQRSLDWIGIGFNHAK